MIGVTNPLFEFGSGLSYTNFTCSNISCNATFTGYNYPAIIFIEDRDIFVSDLLSKMSVAEKVGQMTQIDVNVLMIRNTTRLNPIAMTLFAAGLHVGSYLNSPTGYSDTLDGKNSLNSTEWLNIIKTIQQYTIAGSPNKIPMLYGVDSVHGAILIKDAVLFPHNFGIGATFNPELAKKAAMVSSKDTSSVGIPWSFTPVLDIGINPLWARTYETFGEDPYLVSKMGAHVVNGVQGGRHSSQQYITMPSTLCSIKHFLGYSDPLSGKDRSSAWYLTEVLRDELMFDGMVISDYMDVLKLRDFHHVASNEYSAIYKSLDAGIDMSMVPFDISFTTKLISMVKGGAIPESRLDHSVRKVLNLKYSAGLFNNPYPDPNNEYAKTIGSKQDRQLAVSIIQESITLLKNKNNVLPLNENKMTNILVTGPMSNSLVYQSGGWTVHWQGANREDQFSYGTTILNGIRQVLNNTNANVMYELGTEIENINATGIAMAAQVASVADGVVICLGEKPYAEIKGNIDDLSMDRAQIALLESVISSAKGPVVLVLVQGRPRIIPSTIIAKVDAVIMAYLPGPDGGQPIADIIFGRVNPSGRLPLTYPNNTADIVPYYHKYQSQKTTSPLFPFGHGLSYTTFTYSNITCNATRVSHTNYTAPMMQHIDVGITIQNTGTIRGKETVLLYIGDLYAEVTPEVKMLKNFNKIDLEPGQTTTVHFVLDPLDFSFIGIDNKVTIEAGQFNITIGPTQLYLELE
eukprot:gene13436-15834_t